MDGRIPGCCCWLTIQNTACGMLFHLNKSFMQDLIRLPEAQKPWDHVNCFMLVC